MIETSGVIEKEQGNGFYLVTLEQPAGHQCLCRAAGKLTKFRIKLLAGDTVLVEVPDYDADVDFTNAVCEILGPRGRKSSKRRIINVIPAQPGVPPPPPQPAPGPSTYRCYG